VTAPAVLFGELTGDGKRIILIAQGDSWQLNQAGLQLKHITPLVSKAQGGALYVPATWATVTQLAHTFTGSGNGDGPARWVPLPRLQAWILAEFTRRTQRDSPLQAEFPPWLKLRDYQAQGAAQIAGMRKFLLCDEPGLGKSACTIAGLAEIAARGGKIFPAVIVVPSWNVADVWVREIAAWVPGWRTVLWGGPGRDIGEALEEAGILITTYATARIDAATAGGPLAKLQPVTVIADECVTHDTLIPTPQGRRRICDLRAGDMVLGYDHVTRQRIFTPVLGVSRSRLRPVTGVGGVHLTPEHPVFVSSSLALCYANDYDADDIYMRKLRKAVHQDVVPVKTPPAGMRKSVRRPAESAARAAACLQRDLRMVREVLHADKLGSPETTPVLQQELLGTMAHVPAGIHGHAQHPETAGILPPERAEGAQFPGVPGLHRIQPQPVPGSGGTSESTCDPGRARLGKPDRRQRNWAYRPAGEIARIARAGLDDGTGDPDRDAPGLRLPAELQSGHREPGPEGRDRGARQRPWQEGECPGPEEAGPADLTWLDGDLDMERADPGRSLWNLETGTGNYFAAGSPLMEAILVHNCHALKGNSTKQSLAVRRIAAHAGNVIALTGTPVTKDTGDVFPALNAMDPAAWPSRERFVKRYCTTTDSDYGETIEGLNRLAEPELRAVLLGSMRRVAKADVLSQLPPKVYSMRRVEIPPEWRKAYDGMADDMLAQLPDGGELPVMETLAQMTRLSQLASSAADVTVTEEADELTGMMKKHYEVTLKAPSWKADALLGILAERAGQPVSVFAVSRQLIMIAGEACEKAGYRTGYITGTTPRKERAAAIDSFQDGKLDVILATTGAGGTGITLTAAGTAVFLQRPWSLAESLQAEDRQHRLGSERHEMVEIIDVVAKETIDESVRAALRDKAGQLSSFVKDPRLVRQLLGGLK
jgi:hypothetical protein